MGTDSNLQTDWIHQVREEIAREEKELSWEKRILRLKKATDPLVKELNLKVQILSEK